MSHAKPHVVLYSTPICSACKALAVYLSDQGVPFTSKDLLIDEDAARRLEDQGVHSVPALEIDGQILAGPNLSRAKVDALLGLGQQPDRDA